MQSFSRRNPTCGTHCSVFVLSLTDHCIFSPMENSICRKSAAHDTERTKEMSHNEFGLVSEVSVLTLEYTSTSGISDVFLNAIQKMIDDLLEEVQKYLQEEAPDGQILHGYRRMIAILHEEVDLHKQGYEQCVFAMKTKHRVSLGRG